MRRSYSGVEARSTRAASLPCPAHNQQDDVLYIGDLIGEPIGGRPALGYLAWGAHRSTAKRRRSGARLAPHAVDSQGGCIANAKCDCKWQARNAGAPGYHAAPGIVSGISYHYTVRRHQLSYSTPGSTLPKHSTTGRNLSGSQSTDPTRHTQWQATGVGQRCRSTIQSFIWWWI